MSAYIILHAFAWTLTHRRWLTSDMPQTVAHPASRGTAQLRQRRLEFEPGPFSQAPLVKLRLALIGLIYRSEIDLNLLGFSA